MNNQSNLTKISTLNHYQHELLEIRHCTWANLRNGNEMLVQHSNIINFGKHSNIIIIHHIEELR